jgi:hypothetical protein
MSGTITSTHDSALTLTSAQFADPVTNFGTISLTTAGTALYAATGWGPRWRVGAGSTSVAPRGRC